MRRLAFVCVVVAGCKGGISKEDCHAQAGALSALFAAANLEPTIVPFGTTTHPVMRSDLPAWTFHPAPVVYVAPGRIAFPSDDHPVPDRAELGTLLAAEHARVVDNVARGAYPMRRRPDLRNVFVVIDGATPWREVVDVVGAAEAAGMTAPVFVFELPTTTTPPPRAPIDAELDKALTADASESAMAIAKLAGREVEHCPAAQRAFRSVGADDSDDKAKIFATAIPEALVECDCKVDVPNLRAVMWRVLVNPHPVRGVGVDLAGATDTIALPASTPWSEASKRFTPTTKRARLAVAGG